MRKFGLRPKLRRGKPWKKGDVGRAPTGIPNLIKHRCPLRAHVCWARDFTYLPWDDGFVYVATVIDLFTREIVGWHVGLRHTTDLVIEDFLDAVERSGAKPQIFHSDQGSEYVSGQYERLLENLGARPSQSKKSSPWENGHQESFYNNFKLELGDVRRFRDLGELVGAVHSQIRYYNTSRIHTALKMPPIVFRRQQQNKNAALVAAVNLRKS